MLSIDLIASHMAGDYLLQTDFMARHKLSSWKVRLLHVLMYGVPFIPVAFFYATPRRAIAFLICLCLTHFIVDSRRWASGDKWPPKPILVDQALHLVTISILGHLFFVG